MQYNITSPRVKALGHLLHTYTYLCWCPSPCNLSTKRMSQEKPKGTQHRKKLCWINHLRHHPVTRGFGRIWSNPASPSRTFKPKPQQLPKTSSPIQVY